MNKKTLIFLGTACLIALLFPLYASANSEPVAYLPLEDTYVVEQLEMTRGVISQGRLPNQAGANGIQGAPWTLYDNGTLEVGGGFIHVSANISPWNQYSDTITQVVFTDSITAGTSLRSLFRHFRYVTTIEGLELFDTSDVTTMAYMFLNNHLLEYANVSNWDTSNVTQMQSMFARAHQLITLDVSNWDTSQVTNMHNLFFNAYAINNLDVSNWDTGNVTTMHNTFRGTNSLTRLYTLGWDTANVINMSYMFLSAHSLEYVNVSNWDTSHVTEMQSMFARTHSLTNLDVSNWDTSQVTNMHNMFFNAHSLISLDASNWDTRNVASMYNMFRGANSLTTLNVSGWDTRNVARMMHMFLNATSLNTLTLGENFVFIDNTSLPRIRETDEFTGFWQNVGDGVAMNPRGRYLLTSAELQERYEGATMADTFVWQPTNPEVCEFNHWDPYSFFNQGELVIHNGRIYRARVTFQGFGDLNWAPGIAHSLWWQEVDIILPDLCFI